MKYKIITHCTAVTEYVVEANSPEEAEEKYLDGDTLSDQITDYWDEDINRIEEIK